MKKISAKQREVFEIIETLGYWERAFNANVLKVLAGLQWQMALKHISAYREMHPQAFTYDPASKLFKTNQSFTPSFISTDWEHYHHHLVRHTSIYNHDLLHPSSVELIPFSYNTVCPEIMSSVIQAIRNQKGVRVKYHSMNHPRGLMRTIFPHAIGFNGRRWHVRAYSSEHMQFRDFNLSRLSSPKPDLIDDTPDAIDTLWHTIAALKLKPHPKLDNHQKKLVLQDYGVAKPFTVKIRMSLVQYFVQYHQIALSESDNPLAKPLLLDNSDAFTSVLFEQEKH